MWAGLPFRYVRGSEADAPLRILFFTDVHSMLEKAVPEKLRETAKLISETPFDLVIGGGDFVHGGFQSTREAMKPRFQIAADFLGWIGHPVEAVLGNHDMVGVRPDDGSEPESDTTADFRALTGVSELWRRFDRNGYRIFILQSIQPVSTAERYHGRIADEQLIWLKTELENTPRNMPLIVCTHIPFRTTFIQAKEGPNVALAPNLVVQNANDVLTLFENHRLILVLQGHLHVNESIRWNQTEFLMGGAVSGSWWNGPNLGTPAGFGIVALGDPNRAFWEYQSIDAS